MEENKNKNMFYFNNKEIALLGAFLILILACNFIWVLGYIGGNIFYGVVVGTIFTVAAIVIDKKYTILTLGIVATLIDLMMGSGFFMVIPTLIGAICFEAILLTSKPYAGSMKFNVIGAATFGILSRISFLGINIAFFDMVLPDWMFAFMLFVPIFSFALGGLIGTSMGQRIKTSLVSL